MDWKHVLRLAGLVSWMAVAACDADSSTELPQEQQSGGLIPAATAI